MKSIFKIGIFFLICIFFAFACKNKNSENNSTIQFSQGIESVLHDTNSASSITDSIKKEILQTKSDTTALTLLNDFSYYDQDKRGILSTEVIAQSKKINYERGLSFAYAMRAWDFNYQKKYDSATYFLNQSQNLSQKINDKKQIAQDVWLQGFQEYKKNNYPAAAEFFNKAILLSKALNDKKQLALCYYYLGRTFQFQHQTDYEKSADMFEQSVQYATAANDKMQKVVSLRAKARIYGMLLDYKKFQEYIQQALAAAIQIHYKDEEATCYNMLGAINDIQANYPEAINYYNKSIQIATELGDKSTIASSLSTMGTIYYEGMDDNVKALQYLNSALTMAEQVQDKYRITYCLNMIGGIYEDQKNYSSALSKYQESMQISKEMGNDYQTSVSLHSIANIYYLQSDFQKALELANQALQLSQKEEDKIGISYCLELLSRIYLSTNNIPKAKEIATENLQISKDILSIRDANKYAGIIAEKEGNYKAALQFYQSYILYRDSVNNITQVKKVAASEFKEKETQLKSEQEKKEAVFKAEDEKKAIELKKQKIIQYGLITGILLILIFAISIYRSLKQNKRKTQIIALQKVEMESQKLIVEEKNKEITDSITYAKRLQEAILPPIAFIKEQLPDSFVLYQPKDIVAGDFYWMEEVENILFIAAADCTGHGVPGAMVSVVCSNALNRAVKEFKITTTGKILDKVRELVLETFQRSESEVKDGMDISICALDKMSGKIEWSGANNSLWYIQNNQLNIIKADKQPIGKHYNPQPFTSHQLNLTKGTIFYLFTDGYADQFGGADGKKFKYKQLQKLLLDYKDESMDNQKKNLEKHFFDWKNNLEQVDDVLLIGIKI